MAFVGNVINARPITSRYTVPNRNAVGEWIVRCHCSLQFLFFPCIYKLLTPKCIGAKNLIVKYLARVIVELPRMVERNPARCQVRVCRVRVDFTLDTFFTCQFVVYMRSSWGSISEVTICFRGFPEQLNQALKKYTRILKNKGYMPFRCKKWCEA